MLGRGSCSRPNGRPKQRLVSIPWPRRSPHMTISRGREGEGEEGGACDSFSTMATNAPPLEESQGVAKFVSSFVWMVFELKGGIQALRTKGRTKTSRS